MTTATSPADNIRERTIVCHPLAQGREAMATFLVRETNQTISEILVALSLAPPGQAPVEDDDADDHVNFRDLNRGRES